jgi:hypothetical protein
MSAAPSGAIEPAPSCPAAVREARMWLLRDAMQEYSGLLESLAVSMGQAAWRGHNIETCVHARQARLVIIKAMEVVKELEALHADLPEGL